MIRGALTRDPAGNYATIQVPVVSSAVGHCTGCEKETVHAGLGRRGAWPPMLRMCTLCRGVSLWRREVW